MVEFRPCLPEERTRGRNGTGAPAVPPGRPRGASPPPHRHSRRLSGTPVPYPGAALEPLPALDSCDSSRVRWDRAATASRPWGRKVVFAARLRTQGLRWGVGRRACVYMCVPAPSAAWDRRLKEGNCQIGASC